MLTVKYAFKYFSFVYYILIYLPFAVCCSAFLRIYVTVLNKILFSIYYSYFNFL